MINWFKRTRGVVTQTDRAEPFAYAATTLAQALESVFREIRGEPQNSRLMRQETAAFALTYCTLIALAALKGKPQDVKRRCDEMNSAAVDEFVKRGWVPNRGELIQKLGERYADYSGTIEYEIFKIGGKNEHGGPHFAFAAVCANAYQISGTPPIMDILLQLETLMESLIQATTHVRNACA